MDMKKIVLKLYLNEDRHKQKAMKAVTSLSGVESIAVDAEKKLTVIGTVDLIAVVNKLRKICRTDVLSVGPAKEPEKKKEEPQKDGPKKEEDNQILEFIKAHPAYNPCWRPHYYVSSAEENPNNCVIC